MYKTRPSAATNVTAIGKNEMAHLEWTWQTEKPYIASTRFYIYCKRSDATGWNFVTSVNCEGSNGGIGASSSTFYGGSTNADVFGLQNGVSYDFMIRSGGNILESAYVAYVYNITPQASTYVPSPPVVTNIAVNTSGYYNASWSAPINDGGSPVVGYMVMNQCSSYPNGTAVQLSHTSFSATATGSGNQGFGCLSPTTSPAKISVIAFNANGASAPSEPIEVWSRASLKPPSAPSNIKVNNLNTDQTMLSWTAPSDNGAAITNYEMRYSTQADFSDWTGTTGTDTCVSSTPTPPTTSCVSNSLTIGVQYYFQVRATNANGAGDWSIIHSSIVGSPDRPIISSISTTTIDSSTSSIYLEGSPPADNGAAITSYSLEYSSDPSFDPDSTTTVSITSNLASPSYTLSSASNGTVYYFRVLATNSRGDSPYSDPVQAIPYAPPSNLSISPAEGFIMGGNLTTITGDNLNSTTSVTIGGNPCQTFAVVDSHTINCLTPAGTIGAQDVVVTNLGGSASIVDGFTYNIPSLTVEIDDGININVTNPTAGTVSDSHNITVKTDNPTGYKINISMTGTNQNLESNNASISPTDASLTASALPINTWGHSIIDANNHWTNVPISTYPRQIKQTTNPTTGGMAGAGDTTPVYYGVNLDLTQRAGQYRATVLYTVVADY
jgi:hypothetical protein